MVEKRSQSDNCIAIERLRILQQLPAFKAWHSLLRQAELVAELALNADPSEQDALREQMRLIEVRAAEELELED